jgi:hypothetical protein
MRRIVVASLWLVGGGCVDGPSGRSPGEQPIAHLRPEAPKGLDGGGVRLDVEPIPEELERNGPLTLEAWVRLPIGTEAPGAYQTIVEARTRASERTVPYGLYIETATSQLVFQAWDGDQVSADFGSTSRVSRDGRLHHVVATRSGAAAGSTVALYIDGNLDSTFATKADQPRVADLRLAVGNQAVSYRSHPFFGAIDDVEIYAHPLSSERIVEHHRSELAVVQKP